MSDWTRDLHRAFLVIAGVMNDPERDEAFLARAGVSLERGLLPLLSRIGVEGPMGTVQLAALVGRDHSTVSRQAARLEKAGLVRRTPAPDRRFRLLELTAEGRMMLAKLSKTRSAMIEHHFRDWSPEDRETFVHLLTRATQAIGD